MPTVAMIEAGKRALEQHLGKLSPGAVEDALPKIFEAMDACAWEPIEAAPRDGTVIWATCGKCPPTSILWHGDGWICQSSGRPVTGRLIEYWRHMPSLPEVVYL